jgi:hypothetical protein
MIPKGTVLKGKIVAALLIAGWTTHLSASTTFTNTESPANGEPFRVAVSFPAKNHPTPISGRNLLFMCHSPNGEPAQSSMTENPQPVFGIDVTNLTAGTEVVFDPTEFYSFKALAFGELKPGTHYAQALVDLDRFTAGYHSPRNLYSPMLKCQVTEGPKGGTVKLVMSETMPKSPLPRETERIRSGGQNQRQGQL